FHFKSKPSQIRQIGQDKSHLKMQFNKENFRLEAIGFRYGHLFPLLSSNIEVDIVGKLQINEWNGNRTVQLVIEDLAILNWQLFDYRGRKSLSTIQPYISFFDQNLMLGNNPEQLKEYIGDRNDITIVTYDDNLHGLVRPDILYIYDLPDHLQSLETVVQETNPRSIHVSYQTSDNAYLQYIPSRDEFKWLYGYLFKNSTINLNLDLTTMMQIKRWSKDKLIFMLKVFIDLSFITIRENVLHVNKQAEKRELQTSPTYQKRLEQINIEKVLYYSTCEELKQWFN